VRAGIEVLSDSRGSGQPVRRHEWYHARLKMWLSRGDPVRWTTAWGTSPAHLEDDGETLDTHFRYDREHLIAGIFQGCEGMNVGGTRKLRIAPHLAYREAGVSGSIPPNALLTVEISFLSEGLPTVTSNTSLERTREG
jgi:hypothetical protein